MIYYNSPKYLFQIQDRRTKDIFSGGPGFDKRKDSHWISSLVLQICSTSKLLDQVHLTLLYRRIRLILLWPWDQDSILRDMSAGDSI
ncbi:unnamed protein product [Allacma fusca]|uniref:Uncharacterized protein n=1 Tax=Allacma fusca TaxID=39272 RepID=A0A8J2K1B4_9HEXA|nr:unnamed protein product [Allacma fusca]